MKSLLVLAALLLPAVVRADDLEFVTRSSTGKEFTGQLLRLENWSLQHGKGIGRRFAPGEWFSLRQVNQPLPELPTDEHLILANGDRIPFNNLRLDDEQLFLEHSALAEGKPTAIPLSSVAIIWRQPPDGIVSAERLRHRLLRGKRSRDVLLLRNGDTTEGTLQTINAGQVQLEVNKKIVPIRWAQVAAISLSTELLDQLSLKQRYARVTLTEARGRFTLASVASDGEKLTGKTSFGTAFQSKLEQVAGLEVFGEEFSTFADLKISKFEYFPFLDERWNWSANCNVMGTDLRVGESSYDRGLSLHAHSKLTYLLDGKYQVFEALVGLDSREGRLGQVRLQLLLDGKPVELENHSALTLANSPRRLRVELGKAKELTLEVQAEGRAPIGAVVNWVEERFIR